MCSFFTSVLQMMRTNWFKYVFALYTLTFLVILPICLYETRFSLYYWKPNLKSSQERQRLINSDRIKMAEHYFNLLNKTKLNGMFPSVNNKEQIDIMISVITMSRARIPHQGNEYDPKYLTQTVWKFLSLFQKAKSEKYPYSVKFTVCNVDLDTETYYELNLLKKYVPVVSRFRKKQRSTVHVLEKEKQDYVFCLNNSLQFRPRYSFLVEDDAPPESNMFDVLRYIIEMHLDQKYHDEEFRPSKNNTAYIKFYHPERLLNYWSIDPERLTELLSSSIICATLIYSILNSAICKVQQRPNWLALWIVLAIYFILLFTAIGRANVNKWRNVFSPYLHSFSPAPSCCTPAVLYPYSEAPHIVSYLSSVQCKKGYAKDTVLDNMLRHKKLKAYIVQPSTFQHIGMYSSLHSNLVDPSKV